MPIRVLHLFDPTTPADALDILAHIRAATPAAHHFAALGHRSTGLLAEITGIPPQSIAWLPSMGWADPTGWRALRSLIKRTEPTHLHAWGAPAAVALGMSRFTGPKLATFADLPALVHRKILRRLDRRCDMTWIATSVTLRAALMQCNLRRVEVIVPGIDIPDAAVSISATKLQLRQQLGIAPDEGPILLLGGEGQNVRGDYGIWTAAIIGQILPHTRLILRQDSRTQAIPGLDRFLNCLPEENLIVAAPREFTWRALMPAADIFIVTAGATVPTGSVLQAMATGVPIVASPIDAMKELIEHRRNGILAAAAKPRMIAAELQAFLNDPSPASSLTANAQADIRAHFTVNAMRTAYAESYQ